MTPRSGLVICLGLVVVIGLALLLPTHAPRILIGFVIGALTFLAADAAGRWGARRQ